jgi:Helicase HerA, central domain
MPVGTAKPEVPRWRRKKQPPGPSVRLSPRQERRLVKRLGRHPPQAQAPQPDRGAVAQTQAFRFRWHLIPFGWLAILFAAGFAAHAARALPAAVTGSLAAAAVTVLLTRHLKGFTLHAWWAIAALTAVLVPALAAAGPGPVAALTLACWACVTVPWMRHYRWRPLQPAAQPDPSDYERWNALCEERKWNGHLGTREDLPGGGRRYPIQTDGIKTVMGNVLAASENLAGAWHLPMTEAFAERDQAGITSRGYLTILGRETLLKPREWNGAGMDPATGLACVGRYPDGAPVHVKFYTRRYGTRHALVSGTTGSGKSELLNLIIFIALTSGCFVPVVLDPQNGQSLPFWRGRCLYAAGEDECRAMIAGLHAGMMDRSAYLAGLRWDDDGVPMTGMPFFDYEQTGLRMPLIIFDEAHMMLKAVDRQAAKTIERTVDISRLGRKTGTALWLATQIPSLADLGGEQALRDMLRGGNVISMRTANTVGKGMLGLVKDPSEIPMYFADGKETYGLGYAAGPDNRPDAPMRTDLVPTAAKRRPPVAPQLDDRFREAMDRELEKAKVASIPAPAALSALDGMTGEQVMDGIAHVARSLSKAADTVLMAVGSEMDRGQIIAAVMDLCEAAGRKPYSIRAISDALADLTAAGKIRKIRHGVYAPQRLHVVGDTP